MTAYMVQLRPDVVALVRFLESQRMNLRDDENLGYGVHAWLAALFGELAPSPFRLFAASSAQRPPKILAYTQHSRQTLLDAALTFAEPAARAACDLDHDLLVSTMPSVNHFPAGRKLGFEVLACPVVRRSADGVEKDAFLHRIDSDPEKRCIDRESVYKSWLADRFTGCAELHDVRVESFRLLKQIRRTHGRQAKERRDRVMVRPHVQFRGYLEVRDPSSFYSKLCCGFGRHRSFGYGMLLLKPL